MIAVFIRELRRNGKWACIAMLVIAGMMACLAQDAATSGAYEAVLLVNRHVTEATAIAFSGCGFVLGLLAVWPDHGVGRWALLTHRPISRRRIFLAKLAAASSLYAIAVLLPLIGVALWAAAPGNLAAPFTWPMVLPRLVDVWLGVAWVAAGMYVAARRARWIGSRLLGAGAAAAVSISLAWLPEQLLPQTLGNVSILVIIALLMLGGAALGAYAAGGSYESQPWLTRMCQLLSSAWLIGTAVSIASFRGSEFIQSIWPPTYEHADHYYAYALDSRGHVLLMDRRWSSALGRSFEKFTDITPGENGPAATSISEDRVVAVPVYRWAARSADLFDQAAYAQVLDSPWGTSAYYVPAKRVIEIYDTLTHRYMGSLGAQGFAPAGQAAAPFPEDLDPEELQHGRVAPNVVVFSPESLWRIFTAGPFTAQKIFQTQPNDPILAFGKEQQSNSAPARPPEVGVVCLHSVVLLDASGQSIVHVPVNLQSLPPANVSITAIDGGYALLVQRLRATPFITTHAFFLRTDRDGTIVRRTELPDLTMSTAVVVVKIGANWALAMPGVTLARTLALAPLAPLRKPAVLLILTALVAAACGWFLTRRYTASSANRWAWTIICALLGVTGLLLLLCTRTAVVRVKCPACGRKRFVTQEHCRHCGAQFDPPRRTGVEIFESHQAPAEAM